MSIFNSVPDIRKNSLFALGSLSLPFVMGVGSFTAPVIVPCYEPSWVPAPNSIPSGSSSNYVLTYVTAFNNNGQVDGNAYDYNSNRGYGFVRDMNTGETSLLFGTGDDESEAYANLRTKAEDINNLGQVVGSYYVPLWIPRPSI